MKQDTSSEYCLYYRQLAPWTDDPAQPVLVLRRAGEAQSSASNIWHGHTLSAPVRSYGPDEIGAVVKEAREAECATETHSITVKVEEETTLQLYELLSLLEATPNPIRLDISRCDLYRIDLRSVNLRQHLDIRSKPPLWLVWAERDSGNELEIVPLGVNLSGVRLRRASLSECRLTGALLTGADLSDAYIDRADLTGTRLGGANLQGAELDGAQLRGAELGWANLRGASLLDTDLEEARLSGSELQEVDLYQARSLRGITWRAAFLNRTRMRRDQLGYAIGDELHAHKEETVEAYHEASEAYLLLKNNFNSIGRYEDASWAYVKEKQMEKMAYRREWRSSGLRIWRAPGCLWRWLRNWAYELLTGYGERPILPLLWGAGLAAVFFPLLYWAIGALPGHGAAFTSSSPSDIDWAGWGNSVVFSLTSFGTLSFSRLQPEGTLPNLIAAFEAMIGVLLFALFVFTLGNRMSRS